MDIQEYFENRFPSQLRQISFRRPNRIVAEEIMEEPDVRFFGGQNWDRIERDLSRIPVDDRPYFILSLFMITLADQCMHAHYREQYPKWKQLTGFPKFGWAGFGPHIENPLKILWIPEKKERIEKDSLIELLPGFTEFMQSQMEDYFSSHFPEIDTKEFLEKIKEDGDLDFEKGQLVSAFKKNLNKVND